LNFGFQTCTLKLALSSSKTVFRKNGKSLSSDFFHHEKFLLAGSEF
jgi:hypothetical protein